MTFLDLVTPDSKPDGTAGLEFTTTGLAYTIFILIFIFILYVLFHWIASMSKTEKIEELEKKVIELEAIIKNNKE